MHRSIYMISDWKNSPAEVCIALETISALLPIYNSKKGLKLNYEKVSDADSAEAKKTKGFFLIKYGRLDLALRLTGDILAGMKPGKISAPFKMFGFMFDISRNSVMTMEYLKKNIVRIALLGYNTLMLYTEDTYEIDGEPFFGFMRGHLTKDDVREIDDFCAILGIKLIPCIQALGHLEGLSHWNNYNNVMDTSDILLVDEKKTYVLIEKMLTFWRDSVRSRRIHIGFDETPKLGRGKFYDLYGNERHFDIFNRHLGKVAELCRSNGFEPMIWSDMYFSLGSKIGSYYDKDTVIPKDVANSIPENVKLVYWDYYHEDKAFYLDWIGRHRAIGREPLMASGIWTWNHFWCDFGKTVRTVTPCLEACRESGLDEIIFATWGDDGGFCNFESAFAGIVYAAEMAFTGQTEKKTLSAKHTFLIDGFSYEYSVAVSEVEHYWPALMLMDDPLMMCCLGSGKLYPESGEHSYREAFEIIQKTVLRLAALKRHNKGSSRFADAYVNVQLAKFKLVDVVIDAYLSGNREKMKAVLPLVDSYAKNFDTFIREFRKMWLVYYKPFGLETMQIRFAGHAERISELKRRLKEYISGKIDTIPEIEELKKIGKQIFAWEYRLVSHGTTII